METRKVSKETKSFCGLRSHPLTDLLVPEDASCRICWSSSYDDTGMVPFDNDSLETRVQNDVVTLQSTR